MFPGISPGFKPDFFSSLLFAFLTWLLLIFRFGYTFGIGDQVELMPYVLFLQNPTLYPHDLFIQGMETIIPNERTVIVAILSLFHNFLEPAVFVLHLLCTLVLVLGLEQIARRFIGNKYLVWLSILFCLIPFYNRALGGVDLYYNSFQASSLAKAIAVWSLLMFLDKKYIISVILVSLATFIQPIVGLTLMIVFGSIILIHTTQNELSLKKFIAVVSIYASTAGVFLVWLLLARNTGESVLSNEAYFNILFLFRHPHHYIYGEFPAFNRIFFSLLMLPALWYFIRRGRQVTLFIMVSLLILIVYAVLVDIFHITFIANFQWYKITIWLKLLEFVAIFGIMDEYVKARQIALNKKVEMSLLFIGTLLFVPVIFLFHYSFFPVPYHFGEQAKKDPLLSITAAIPSATPVDAVFIQPFDNTSLKFYGRRSSYVEFKANVKDKRLVEIWYKRIQEVYDIDVHSTGKGFHLKQQADDYYFSHSPQTLQALKEKGITYIFTKRSHDLPGMEVILQNEQYKVVKL